MSTKQLNKPPEEFADKNRRSFLLIDIENYIKNKLGEELGTKYNITIKVINNKTIILINNREYKNHFLIKENGKIREINLNPNILNENNRTLANVEEYGNCFIIKLKIGENYIRYKVNKSGECTEQKT